MENLESLNATILRRSQQIELIASYLGESTEQTLPGMFVHGLPCTGKTLTIKAVVQHLKHRLVVVDCVESSTPRLLFEAILLQLIPLYDRCCLNANSFVEQLKGGVSNDESIYILLERAERLRDMHPSTLPILLTLQPLTEMKVGVILESQVLWEKFREGTAVSEPILIHFPQYSREDLLEIMSLDCPPGCPAACYSAYVRLLLDVFLLVCHSLSELRYLASVNFPKYVEPVLSGEVKLTEGMGLWRRVEDHLRGALNSLYLREHLGASELRCSLELPVHSKYLLIAAYLASFNPAKLDKRLFVKFSSKKKNSMKKKSMKKEQRTANQVLGPKYFTLDRLIAIFTSVGEQKVVHTASIFSQVSSLVSLGLLSSSSSSSSSSDNLIDTLKYKCLIPLPLITALSKTVGFEILKYLYDFL